MSFLVSGCMWRKVFDFLFAEESDNIYSLYTSSKFCGYFDVVS